MHRSFRRNPPYVLSPLFDYHQGRLLFSMDAARLGPPASATRVVPELPPLTAAQRRALDQVQKAAREHEIRLASRPGDMIYLHSWSTLHAREPYQDDKTASRHLVRLWLRDDALGWPVPDSMKMPWESSFGEAAQQVLNPLYPVVPMPVYMEPKYHNTTAAFVADDDDDGTGGGWFQDGERSPPLSPHARVAGEHQADRGNTPSEAAPGSMGVECDMYLAVFDAEHGGDA